MKPSSETITRSFAKTISWRVVVFVIDFLVAYALTGNVDLSSKLAIAKLIISSVFYFIHERFWNELPWGKS